MSSPSRAIVDEIGECVSSQRFRYLDAGEYPLRANPNVGAVIVTEQSEHTDPATIGWYFGRKALKQNDRPPRVTWIPTSSVIEGQPNRQGKMDGKFSTVQLTARTLSYEVHIQGRDYEQTEHLMNLVMAAAHQAGLRSLNYLSETWFTQTESGADYAVDGEKVILKVTAGIPVLASEDETLVVEGAEATGELIIL